MHSITIYTSYYHKEVHRSAHKSVFHLHSSLSCTLQQINNEQSRHPVYFIKFEFINITLLENKKLDYKLKLSQLTYTKKKIKITNQTSNIECKSPIEKLQLKINIFFVLIITLFPFWYCENCEKIEKWEYGGRTYLQLTREI